eukprot:4412121-Prymnesium_polylepis.1
MAQWRRHVTTMRPHMTPRDPTRPHAQTRDDTGQKCVQFTLSEWMEGANKNQADKIKRQLKSAKGQVTPRDRTRPHVTAHERT